MHPHIINQEQNENYSLLSWVLDRYREESWHRFRQSYSRAKEPRYRKLVDLLPLTADRVLDAGINTGEIMNYMLHHPGYRDVIGVDIQINQLLLDLHPKQQVEIMDLRSLEFDDKSFDLVLCTQVIEHVDPWEDVLKIISELRRVCRGTLILSVPLDERMPLQSDHHHVFTMDLMRSLFPQAVIEVLWHDESNPHYNFPGHVFAIESHDNTI